MKAAPGMPLEERLRLIGELLLQGLSEDQRTSLTFAQTDFCSLPSSLKARWLLEVPGRFDLLKQWPPPDEHLVL